MTSYIMDDKVEISLFYDKISDNLSDTKADVLEMGDEALIIEREVCRCMLFHTKLESSSADEMLAFMRDKKPQHQPGNGKKLLKRRFIIEFGASNLIFFLSSFRFIRNRTTTNKQKKNCLQESLRIPTQYWTA